MAEQEKTRNIRQRPGIVPDGPGILNLFCHRHPHQLAFAPAMTVEVEPDGSDAPLCQIVCQVRHRRVVFAGENAVHENNHRTGISRRVDAVGQRQFHGQPALRATDRRPGRQGRHGRYCDQQRQQRQKDKTPYPHSSYRMKCIGVQGSSPRPGAVLPPVLFSSQAILRASVRIVCMPSSSRAAWPGSRP